jgi:hypothetical protein
MKSVVMIISVLLGSTYFFVDPASRHVIYDID